MPEGEDDEVYEMPEMDAPRGLRLTSHGTRWDAMCEVLAREFKES